MSVGIFFSLMLARILFYIVNLAFHNKDVLFFFAMFESTSCCRLRTAGSHWQKVNKYFLLSSPHHFVLPVLPTHFVEAVSNCELESIHLRRGRLNTIEKQTCSLQSAKKETNWRRFMYFVPGLSNTSFAIIFFMEPQWKHRVLFFGSVYSWSNR